MKITKLEKKKRLYLLELDNDQKLYITEDTIVKYFLSKDKEISENDQHKAETEIQQITDKFIKKVDEVLAEKEKELLDF